METDKIRAAILDKAQKEAEEITVSARLKAEELITNANEQKKNGSRRRKTDYIRGQTRGIEGTGTILPQGTAGNTEGKRCRHQQDYNKGKRRSV